MSRCAELSDVDPMSEDSENDGYDGVPLGSKVLPDASFCLGIR